MKRLTAIATLSVLLNLFAPTFLRSQNVTTFPKSQHVRPGGSCYSAVVEWRDATVHVKDRPIDPNHLDDLITLQTSFGCVTESEHTIVMIFNFNNGQPDTYLAIPKQWAIKITKVGGDDKKPPEPTKEKEKTSEAKKTINPKSQ